MPSSIFFNGRKNYRAGVYVSAEELLTADTGITGGNVAVVGDFPIFEQNSINTFVDADSMLEATQGGKTTRGTSMLDVAQVAFNPLVGAIANIDSLSIINVRETTQASLAVDGVTLKSKLWGNEGNSKKFKLSADSADATKWQFSIKDGGLEVETGTGIGFGEVASLSYDNAGFYTTASVEITSSLFKIGYTKNVSAGANNSSTTVTWGKTHSGAVSFKTTVALAGGQSVVISGIDSAGVTTTETVAMGTALDAVVSSTKSWNEITSFVFTSTGGSPVGNVLISGLAKSLSLDGIDDLEALLSGIVQEDDDFTAVLPSVSLKGEDLDALSLSQIKNSSAAFTADTAALIDALSGSTYITAVKSSNAKITATVDYESLSGGGEASSIPASNWSTALEDTLYKGIQILVAWTDNVTIHEKFKAHCKEAAEISGYNRNCWVGATAGKTLAEIHSGWVTVLNDRNMAICGQGITFNRTNSDSTVSLVKKNEPQWLALMLACMQGCTAIAEPLTNKKPNVIDTIQVFKPLKEAEDAIRKGIVILSNAGGLGNRVERSVTTHIKDNNFVYSEVSANESLNTCLRDVKYYLQDKIGSKAVASAKQDVLSLVIARLTTQRSNSIIKDFRKVTVTASGDYINVGFELAVVEPLNFIIVNAKFGRF
jgi:hypothetical protein